MEFAKQFAIIDKIKSMVVGGDDKSSTKSANQESISGDMASKIQSSAHEHAQSTRKDTYTHPYLIIAEQLSVFENQIFNAAVYTLARMATNNKPYRKPILEILTKTLTERETDKEKVLYITQKIEEIRAV